MHICTVESLSMKPSQREHGVKDAYAGGEHINKINISAYCSETLSNIAQVLFQVK